MKVRLRHKITITFVLLFTAILLCTYYYLDKNLRENALRETRETILKEAALTRTLLEEKRVETLSPREMNQLAGKISLDLGLRITIISLEGRVLGDSDLHLRELEGVENHLERPEVREALLTGTGESQRFSTTVRKQMLYTAKLFGEGEKRGIVRLSLPLAGFEETSAYLKRVLFATLVAAFFLSIVASSIASRVISKRLQEMAGIAQEIAKGDFSRKMVVSSTDETADLAGAFNFMTEQIKARIKDITTGTSRFEAVLLSMFDGVVVVGAKGTILLMNPALAQLLQIKEDPSGKKPVEVLRNLELQELVEEALSLREGVEAREISILMPEPKTLLVHATPVARGENTIGAVLVFHDITELRNLENIRRDFVANVSHELRTPVANIKGYAETLLAGALEDRENAREFIKIVYEESDRLAKLIADILNLSGIESGKLDMVFSEQTIRALVERVIKGLDKRAREKEIKIDMEVGAKKPVARVDAERITQVLFNLMDNALKYTCPGGRVRITAREEGEEVIVGVNDNGIGIPEQDQSRIFERFYRVDKARSREMGGTGLGLSIVKHLVREHGGRVWVESAPGEGSSFFFTVPKA